MASNKQSIARVQEHISPIADVLAVNPVLPGESAELYQSGLIATIKELGANTPLQIYLAEQIFECLWWMSRYENQKRTILIREMASLLLFPEFSPNITKFEAWAYSVMHQNRVNDKEFVAALNKHNYSLESLTQAALSKCESRLVNLEAQIALKAKTLAGFQASYEVLVQRNVIAERMKLQNDVMQRNLQAIEHEPSPTVSTSVSSGQP